MKLIEQRLYRRLIKRGLVCDNCPDFLIGRYYSRFCDSCLAIRKPCSFLKWMTREQYENHILSKHKLKMPKMWDED